MTVLESYEIANCVRQVSEWERHWVIGESLLFDLDGELCFSEAKVMMIGENNEPKEPYKDIGNLSADDAVWTTLQACKCKVYRNFH